MFRTIDGQRFPRVGYQPQERPQFDVTPVDLGNIDTFGDAIWWAVTTMTTVGYGDRFSVTGTGRLVAMRSVAYPWASRSSRAASMIRRRVARACSARLRLL